MEQVCDWFADDRYRTDRVQKWQTLQGRRQQIRSRNNEVLGLGGADRIRELNSVRDSVGVRNGYWPCRVMIADKGVEIGEDVDRVLREVGEAVVFDRINPGRERIVRSHGAEREAQTRQAQTWEAGEQATIRIDTSPTSVKFRFTPLGSKLPPRVLVGLSACISRDTMAALCE